MSRRLARWLRWSVVMLALLYGFLVLGGTLWLRRNLATDNLATTAACWGARDSLAKASHSERHRDGLVMYALRSTAAAGPSAGSGPDLRIVVPQYVYLFHWPRAERDRLFAYIAPRLRPCHPTNP